MKSITGIDGIGTMSSRSEGWSYFSIPELLVSNFSENANDILKKSKLTSFHGKEFKRKKERYYREFLQLIKQTLTQGEESLIACTLLNESWKAEYVGFCSKLIKKSFTEADADIEHLIDTSSKLAAPIFSFMRLTENFVQTDSTIIEIDEDWVLEKFPDQKLIVAGHLIYGSIPIYAASNAYRKRFFPNSPRISKKGFRVLRDDESFMIQAADLFGNFALSYAFKCLGKKTKTNDLKAKIFVEEFDELKNSESITNNLEISKEDLILKQDGAFTVKLSTI